MDTIQAAILLSKLNIFPGELEKREQVAGRYSNLLTARNHALALPKVPESRKSAWAQYSILLTDKNIRSGLQLHLKKNNIPTAIYYPVPLHLQPVYGNIKYEQAGGFPIAEDCSCRILSLPMHPYLTERQQAEICSHINEFL